MLEKEVYLSEGSGIVNQLVKTALTDKDKVFSELKKYVQDRPCSVWMSDTLHLDLNLPLTKNPEEKYKTTQLLCLCEGLPLFLLTLYEGDSDVPECVEDFTLQTAQLLSGSLLRFCDRDFYLLPCNIARKDFSCEKLQTVIKEQQRFASGYYDGPTRLTSETYKIFTAAATAVNGVTYVPSYLQGKKGKEANLHLPDRTCRELLSLFIEKFTQEESSTACEIESSPESAFKAKAVLVDAARRVSTQRAVVICTEDPDIHKCSRQLIARRNTPDKPETKLTIVKSKEECSAPSECLIEIIDHNSTDEVLPIPQPKAILIGEEFHSLSPPVIEHSSGFWRDMKKQLEPTFKLDGFGVRLQWPMLESHLQKKCKQSKMYLRSCKLLEVFLTFTLLKHWSRHHTGLCPVQCFSWGFEVAAVLRSFGLGVAAISVLVLSACFSDPCARTIGISSLHARALMFHRDQLNDDVEDDDVTSPACGFVRGLRSCCMPLTVLDRKIGITVDGVTNLALGLSDTVTVTDCNAVRGLERKVVVYLHCNGHSRVPLIMPDIVSQRELADSVSAVSRCSQQLILIDNYPDLSLD
ncbi:hypothetical protein BaRGS_00034992 [Batillaria attramentaria]|uniref:Uncharacterized protein n=1 Tax=Batillaria attramentaria TaxID=370345 RepID=A0ABD0JFH0_9CAEN